MVIGVVSWELRLDESRSLKDKRSVIQSIKAGLHNEFNVSLADTGRQYTWHHV